jgi:uncharacterized protein YacL
MSADFFAYAAYLPLALKIVWNLGLPIAMYRERILEERRGVYTNNGVSVMQIVDVVFASFGLSLSLLASVLGASVNVWLLFAVGVAATLMSYLAMTAMAWVLVRLEARRRKKMGIRL